MWVIESTVIVEAAEFLLKNQFIMTDVLEVLWHIAKGSGMGWLHSPALADATFFVQFGRMVLQPAFMKCYGIRGFWRYKDDMLLIA